MKNVFIFWVGDLSKIANMVKKIKSQGFNVILGPSKDDDEFLCKNFSYYKKSKEQKIWSFCSDVWRFYVLSKNNGLYVDANEIVGNNFYKLYDELSNYDISVVRGTSHTIGSSVLFSSGKRREIFSEALNLYKKFDNNHVRTFPVGPHVITYVLRNYYTPSFKLEVKDGIAFFPFQIIRDSNVYKKIGSATWIKWAVNTEKYSQSVEDNFTTHKKLAPRKIRNFYNADVFPNVNIPALRSEYDQSSNKSEIKELEEIYKKAVGKKFFTERLIWSKLYRIVKK